MAHRWKMQFELQSLAAARISPPETLKQVNRKAGVVRYSAVI